MSRALPRACGVAVLAACLLGADDVSSAEPRDPIPPNAVAAVDPDPKGEATALLDWAREAEAAEDWAAAVEAIVRLREEHEDALVPVPGPEAGPAPLHWPARRVVEVLVSRLPPGLRQNFSQKQKKRC